MQLFHSKHLTDSQHFVCADAIQTTYCRYGGVVSCRNSAQVVTLAHLVVATLCREFVLLLVGISKHLLAIPILLVFRVDAKVCSLEQEVIATQIACAEVDKTLRVKRLSHIAALEMEVRASTATRVTTQRDRLTCDHPISSLDQSLGEVSVIGLDAIIVTNDYKSSVARIGSLREAYNTIECRADGVAHLQRNVDTVVVYAATQSVARCDASSDGDNFPPSDG